MATKTTIIEIYSVDSKLEYQDGVRDVEGIIFEVNIFVNDFVTDIVYHVKTELDDHQLVDGKTFKKI